MIIKDNATGIGLVLGAGGGIIIGLIFSSNIGISIGIGAGLGLVIGSIFNNFNS